MEPQSLYTYFASKNEIFEVMFLEANEELLVRQQAAAETADPWARFMAGAREFVRFATEDPVRYLLVFQRAVPGFVPSEQAMAVARTLLDQPRQALADLGVHDPGALDLITSGLAGLVAQQNANEPLGSRWTELTDRMVRTLLVEVGAQPPTDGAPGAEAADGGRTVRTDGDL
jgi:AcrR family transcriptional regulator